MLTERKIIPGFLDGMDDLIQLQQDIEVAMLGYLKMTNQVPTIMSRYLLPGTYHWYNIRIGCSQLKTSDALIEKACAHFVVRIKARQNFDHDIFPLFPESQ